MEPGEMVGQRLGHYYITGLIGRGGMATVFLARDIYLNREVALKVFRPRPDAQDTFLRRFEREAQVVARLEHPNILLVYEYGRYEGMAYFAMPYLFYGSLRSYLKEHQKLSPRIAVDMLAPILRALQYAHDRGLIHRDIKPDNLLFNADHSLVLSDFGLVKVLTAEYDTAPMSSFVTHTTSIMGTPQYMSPEQIQGKAVPASDIYSLGIVLYELLTGTAPFIAETAIRVLTMHLYEHPRALCEINPAISPDLEEVVLRALEKDVSRRYQRPLDFLQALIDVVGDDTTTGSIATSGGSNTGSLTGKIQSNPDLRSRHGELSTSASRQAVDDDAFAAVGVSTPSRKQTQLSTAVLPATIARYTTQRQPQRQPTTSRFISLVFLIGLLALVPIGILWSLPILLPMHDTPSVSRACPAAGLVHSAVLAPLAANSQTTNQAVVYVRQIQLRTGFADEFVRYNAETGQATTIKALAGVNVSSAQISPDGQWIVFVASSAQQSQLQVLRIDGSLLQTLYCAPTSNPAHPSIQEIHWSPFTYTDSQRLLFTVTHGTQLYQLFLRNGVLHKELTIPANDQIVAWHDAHHVYLRKATTGSDLYQVEVSDEKTTIKSGLQVIAIASGLSCDAYAVGSHSVTYISHCGGASADCQTCGVTSSISNLGADQPFFSSQTMALSQICSAQDDMLLAISMAQHPTAGVPNGLWSIDVQQKQEPKLLAPVDGRYYQPTLNTSSQDSWANVSRDGRFYAIKLQPVQEAGNTILSLGSLTGRKLKNIATLPSGSNLSLVGWITI